MKEIGNFFAIYKELEEKYTAVEGWDERDAALRSIAESRERLRNRR